MGRSKEDLIRTFIAFDISKEDRESIASYAKQFSRPGISLTKMENLHATIAFIGNISVDEARNLGDKIKSLDFSPLEIHINTLSAFPRINSPRIIWLGTRNNTEALQHYRLITHLLNEHNIAFDQKESYIFHITIARLKKGITRQRLEEIRPLLSTPVDLTITATRITLYQSKLSPKGPIYLPLASTP